jgi:hypothetical protein
MRLFASERPHPRAVSMRSRCGSPESESVRVIENRWMGNQADRLHALAANLVEHRVAVIVAPDRLRQAPAWYSPSRLPPSRAAFAFLLIPPPA